MMCAIRTNYHNICPRLSNAIVCFSSALIWLLWLYISAQPGSSPCYISPWEPRTRGSNLGIIVFKRHRHCPRHRQHHQRHLHVGARQHVGGILASPPFSQPSAFLRVNTLIMMIHKKMMMTAKIMKMYINHDDSAVPHLAGGWTEFANWTSLLSPAAFLRLSKFFFF